jgi:hypothetical protein
MRPPASLVELVGGAGVLIKSTWALFAIAAPPELYITILYYVLEFQGKFNYSDLMFHGIAIILIMVDGFILSRIPLRMKQFVLFESFMAVYLLWTIAHAYSIIGNPFANGEMTTQDDDAIYSSLAWKNQTTQASIFVAVVLIVVNPIIFVVCMALSRLLPLQIATGNEGEEGTITEGEVLQEGEEGIQVP